MATPHDAQVRDVRAQLLHLHKHVLDAARQTYERVTGRVSNTDFLRVLVEDPMFAWLRPLTALITQADEWLEDDERAADVGAAWLAETSRRLTPDPDGDDFAHRYAAMLQDVPDVVLAHGAVMRALTARGS
jgi:hypothetical protein